MPLKSYLQCIRSSECFRKDPRDERMEPCSEDPEVKDGCHSFFLTYKQCKENTLNMVTRMRGNKALRQS
jgi:hypothetical protein